MHFHRAELDCGWPGSKNYYFWRINYEQGASSAFNSSMFQVILGLVEDESDTYFSELEATQGIGPSTRDQYLRTLIRNNYDFHLNEIFATVQNEYSDWMSSDLSGGEIRPQYLQWEAAKAITDRLYTAPILQSANWCNQSGFPVYFYIFGRLDDDEEDLILALVSLRRSLEEPT